MVAPSVKALEKNIGSTDLAGVELRSPDDNVAAADGDGETKFVPRLPVGGSQLRELNQGVHYQRIARVRIVHPDQQASASQFEPRWQLVSTNVVSAKPAVPKLRLTTPTRQDPRCPPPVDFRLQFSST